MEIPKKISTYGKLRQWCNKKTDREVIKNRLISALIDNFLKQEMEEGMVMLMKYLKANKQ